MQGLYTTLSYIVIFFLAASTIRSKAQIDRAISVALVVSFPIAFYGIIQHYFLDPLPWGGDVTSRVASNMGNSIFVGAYLIMVVPLALGRLIQSVEQGAREMSSIGRLWMYALAFLSAGVVFAVWLLSFEFGAKNLIEGNYTGTLTPEMLAAAASSFNLALSVTFVVVLAWLAAALVLKRRAGVLLLVGLYAMLLAVQTVCLLFTQSRGPFLGFLGAIVTFFFLLLVTAWRRRDRVLTVLSGVVLSLVASITLAGIIAVVLLQNVGFRDLPYIGRLGSVFDTEGGTGEVRVLIWGARSSLPCLMPHCSGRPVAMICLILSAP